MDQVKAFFGKYWHTLAALMVLLLVIYAVYYAYKYLDKKKEAAGLTEEEKAAAESLAKRIYEDLNSGTVLGYNFFGMIGRDLDAYKKLSLLSDPAFEYAAYVYNQDYNSSLIADIRAESSIAGNSDVDHIEDRASKLNLA